MSFCTVDVKNTFVHLVLTGKKGGLRKSSTEPAIVFAEFKPIDSPSSVSTQASAQEVRGRSFSSVSTQSSETEAKGRMSKFAKAKPDQFKTTVMIRNIPCRCTQEQLMEEVAEVTPLFNFLYLPASRRGDGNLGYAFVNFVAPKDAMDFIDAFQNHEFTRIPQSEKRAFVTFAVLQGFKQNVRFYRRSKVIKGERGPYINRDVHA